LDGDRAFRAEFAASGHGVAGSVSRAADSARRKAGPGNGPGWFQRPDDTLLAIV
jgi:hypothetical protein